jgi:hypothetical protein
MDKQTNRVTDEEVHAIMTRIRDDDECKRGGVSIVRELPVEAHTNNYRVVEFDLSSISYDSAFLQQAIMKHVHIPHSHVQMKGLWSPSIARLMIPKYIKTYDRDDDKDVYYVSIKKILQVVLLVGCIYALHLCK